jgi:hypothetical protein
MRSGPGLSGRLPGGHCYSRPWQELDARGIGPGLIDEQEHDGKPYRVFFEGPLRRLLPLHPALEADGERLTWPMRPGN